jgi:hypothetical protein
MIVLTREDSLGHRIAERREAGQRVRGYAHPGLARGKPALSPRYCGSASPAIHSNAVCQRRRENASAGRSKNAINRRILDG